MISLIETHHLQALGIIVGVLALIWAVSAWWLGPRSGKSFIVFLKDNDGLPRNDLILVGCNGDKCLPDASGMVIVPGSWNGSTVSVREHFKWGEIMTVTLVRPRGGTASVTIPR